MCITRRSGFGPAGITPFNMENEKILAVARETGWLGAISHGFDNEVYFDFERVMQSGDIFHFTAVMKGNNVASLIADISEGYESFDIKRTIAEWRRMDATISLDDYIRGFVDFDLVRKDLWTLAGDLARAFRNCPIPAR